MWKNVARLDWEDYNPNKYIFWRGGGAVKINGKAESLSRHGTF